MMDKQEKYCRSATYEDVKQLIKSLNEHQVDYFLIGGYALFTHGYQRATRDIDLLVPATKESAHKLINALMALPEQAAKDIDPEWFIDIDKDEHGTIRVADEFVVDIMFNASGETYESLKSHAQIIDLDGLLVQTVDLEGLLKTKQTVRDKDRADRLVLERALDEIKNRSRPLS
jgi:predicted nucleotidyltransferase